MIDPKWLEALKLPFKVTIAVALAAGILLALNVKGWLDLGAFGAFARPVLIIIAVVATILSLVGVADFIFAPLRERRHVSALAARRAVRKQEEDEQAEAKRQVILARLDHLSDREVDLVARCLRQGSPSFYTYVYSPPAGLLQRKGLIWSSGGTHHQDHYPFSFHDFAWAAIQARSEEFLAKDKENKVKEEAAKARRR